MGAGRRTTIRDVASAAGVSPATVSLVLNDVPGQRIPPSTRERVRAAAAALDYTPHRIARALREGSSRLVLLDAGPLRTRGSGASFIAGLDDELRQHGHALLVAYGEPAADADLLAAVAPRTVMNLTQLYFSGDEPHGDGGWVDGLAAHAATQLGHLAERGHERVALALPDDPQLAPLAALRRRHAAIASEPLGIRLVELTVPRDVPAASGRLRQLEREEPGVTAIAAFDDDTAFVVLAAAAREGIAVPGALAVIGFDEGEHAALWSPALTSLRIDAEAFGRRAARRALHLDPGPWAHPRSEVVARETT